MEILALLKLMAEYGITVPVIIVGALVWQQQKTNSLTDKRLALIEQRQDLQPCNHG